MTESYTTIMVPIHSFQIYQSAARLVRFKMGEKAPSAVDLIWFELSHRDPRMIADDFLENVRVKQHDQHGTNA